MCLYFRGLLRPPRPHGRPELSEWANENSLTMPSRVAVANRVVEVTHKAAVAAIFSQALVELHGQRAQGFWRSSAMRLHASRHPEDNQEQERADVTTSNGSDLLRLDQEYARAFADRQSYVDAIIESPAPRKIVVAGPGTGKTHLFKQVLRGMPKTLTLTFVNSLVEQLALELYEMSDVRTLHSFARSELRMATGKPIVIFPKLPRVIDEDAKILLGHSAKFEKMFYDRDDENPGLVFYQGRKRYYGEWRGYSDVVFDLVRMYENDASRVPQYDQVVIDEFQDFNLLEVSLIDSLAERSPILLAGDDDQALYDFKSASACHIRSKHDDECLDWASFELPYCSRSTRVIVEAVNDVVGAATKRGVLLRGRVDKKLQVLRVPGQG